jgi:hypothetical protein
MAVLDDILSEIGLPSVRVASRRAPRPTFSPEEEASILGTIGQNTLSGLQYVGETLDKPGRAIRGLLAGQPGELANLIPFSDTIGLTDPQQSVSGRGLLEQYGMLSPNEDGIDLGDVAGFGAEVLLDPTTYLTLGASALSKGGNVAKRAGLMKELTKVTGKRVGAREGRLTKTLGDLLQDTGGAWNIERSRKAMDAAQGMGIDDLASIADEPLGGLAGLGLPFRDSSLAIGTGARSQAVARKLDKLGDAVKYSRPVSTLNRLLDAKVGEAKSYVGQKFLMPGAFDASTAARADARGKTFDLMADLARNGGAIADNNQAMRRLYEGIDPAAAPAMAAHVDKYRGAMDPLVTRADAIGMPAHELIDDVAKYATRQLTGVTRGGSSSKVIDVVDQNFQARDPWLKNLTEGTDTILQMRNDPGIQQLRGGPLADLTTDITNRYGSQIPATFEDAAGNVRDQREAIARWFQSMDDNVWESGIYGNHPLVDAATRIVNGYDRVAVGENILDNLDLDTISLADKTSRTPGQSRTLKATLEGMGLVAGDENKGAVKAWMERQGMPVTKAGVDVTGQMNIPLDLSDDLIRRMQAFKSPEAVNEILSSLIDPITNITKAGLTSAAPAFHVRNLASGQWQNAQAGMWSKRAFDVARALATGGTADVGDIPVVKRMLQQQGLPNTPENASDMVRRLGYQFNLTSPQQSIAAVQGRTGAAQGFGDLIAESPGGVVAGRGTPYDPKDAINKFLGRSSAKQGASTAAPYLTDDQISRLPARAVRTEMTPDESQLLQFADNQGDAFSKLSQTHAEFNKGLGKLVNNGAMTPDDAKIARVIFSQSSGRSIAGVDLAYERVIERKGLTNNSDLGRIGGIAERRKWREGGSGQVPDRVTLSKMSENPTVSNSSLKILLHELGHHAYWRMEEGLQSEFHGMLYKDPDGIRKYVDEVLQPTNARTRDKYLNYFSNDPAEFFSERFAHSLIERKVPEGILGQMVDRVRSIVMELISRIKGAIGIEPSLRKRLDEIIDVVGGFDRKAGSPGGWIEPAPVINPQQTSPTDTFWDLRNPGDAADYQSWANSPRGQREGANYLKRLKTGVINQDGSTTRFSDTAGFPLLDDSPSGTTWNPLKASVRGGFSDAAETTFAPIAAGEHIGSYVEFLNRYTPFIDQLQKGVDPAEAAARVMAAQVDYSGRNYTSFERSVVNRLFPFAKFTKGMVPYTLRRLWEKPGGAIAQTIRAQNEGRSGDASAPDYVRETAAIGLGQQEDGSQRYITGFGLPFEDPLSFVGGGVQGALLEGASRLNPLVKAPLEWMTGESFFQKGPQGGREIEDLDPTIGRIMSNVAGWGDGQAAAYSEPVKLPTPVEFLAANSPLSRALTTLRSATDERKHDLGGMMNLLTGFKVSDISPAAQDAVTRERMQALMKSLGAKSFENVYFPKAQIAEMPPEQQMKVRQLEALKQELVRKAKERKAAKETR